MDKWGNYHQMVGEKPNALVAGVLKDYVRGRSAALDLGAGNLRDSKFLLNAGFKRVVAVDKSEESRFFSTPKIELHIMAIEDYEPPADTFNFVFSCNTLFFVRTSQMKRLFERVLKGLRRGGVFACNLLEEKDEWVTEGAPVSGFSETSLAFLCDGFEVIATREVEYEDDHFTPPKFWHQRIVALRKP